LCLSVHSAAAASGGAEQREGCPGAPNDKETRREGEKEEGEEGAWTGPTMTAAMKEPSWTQPHTYETIVEPVLGLACGFQSRG
jgi:hypothetical protein